MEAKTIKRVLICCYIEEDRDDSEKAILLARSFLPDLYSLPAECWQTYNFAQDMPEDRQPDDLYISMDNNDFPADLPQLMSEGMIVLTSDDYESLTAYQWGKMPETVGIGPGMKRSFETFKLKTA